MLLIYDALMSLTTWQGACRNTIEEKWEEGALKASLYASKPKTDNYSEDFDFVFH